VGVGTDPGEGAALAQAALEALADAGARVVATTHYNLLKEMAEVDTRFANASVEFDPRTLAPTYRLRLGAPGSSSATAVAARMGVPAAVLERANALLDREDRRLDQMLSELQASRAALERERHDAEHARVEGEAARDEYRRKLERLQERRDELFARMRTDLERAFKEAHAEVAGVIRSLQRGGGAREAAREAARARERLLALEAKAREAEAQSRADVPEPPRARVDWRSARPGDAVALPGGRLGKLVSLPDRRGRAVVQAGAAKLEIEAERLSAASEAKAARGPAPRPAPRVRVETASPEAAPGRVDLRGLRVDEALDRVTEALDDAAGAGRATLEIVHGIGTGALRRAVREHLARSPYVARWEPAAADRGGEGITIARLGDGDAD
jgi:DNA mismatch repair protein MutS2